MDTYGYSFANRVGLKSSYFYFDYYYNWSRIWVFLPGSAPRGSQVWDSGIGNWDWRSSKLVLGDFSGDGRDDLAILYGYGNDQVRLWVFKNNGAGGFNSPSIWWDSGVGKWNWQASKLVSGDFNHDGRDDIAILYGYNHQRTRVWVFTSNGSKFSSPVIGWDSGVGKWEARASKVVAGDLNGDNLTDLIILYGYANSHSALWALTKKSTGQGFNLRKWWDSGVGKWEARASKITTGNYNSDNKADVAILYGYSSDRTRAWVFTASASRFNSPSIWWDSGVGKWNWQASQIGSDDFNNDGKDDLMIYYGYGGAQTKIWVLSSQSSRFSLPVVWWDSGVGKWEAYRTKVACGRIAANGKAGIVSLYNYGTYPF